MPFPNYHAARIRDPSDFSRIVVLKTLNNGIMIYGGPLKSDPKGSGKTQTYRFPKSKFTVDQAKKWLAEHDIKVILFEKATGVEAFNAIIKLVSKRILSFSQDEIISYIPEKILNKIKTKDPHPFFTMYSICHEGTSSPVVIGEGSKKISWPKRAIQSMKNIIMRGIKFFKGHNKDNSHAGRKSLGKVIHNFQKEIDGKLHQLVIGYHPPGARDEIKELDVCSQESEWNIFEEAGNLIADTIESLTGIALANSKDQTPAFAGAKRLGYIQAFEASGEDTNKDKGDNMPGEGNKTDANTGDAKDQKKTENFQVNKDQQRRSLTFPELKDEIKRMQIYPHQLFTKDDLQKDLEFGAIFNEINLLNEQKVKAETRIKTLTRQTELSTAKNRIAKIVKDEKIPDEIIKFVVKRFDKEKDKIEDLSDDKLKEFIKDKTEDYQDIAKTVNPDFDIEQINGDKKGEIGDLTKAENNELLEEDFEE